MQVIQFSLDLLPALTELINQHIRNVPPCWALSEMQFATTLAQADSLWSAHFPEESGSLVVQTICAVDDERLLAAVQWGLPSATDPQEQREHTMPVTTLFWAIAAPGYEKHLKTLLDAVIVRSRSLGCRTITTTRFAFGLGWSGVPATWPHIIDGLQQAGFEVLEQWVLMTAETETDWPTLPPDSDLGFKWHIDEAAGEWELHAYRNEEQVGLCEVWSVPPHFEGCPGFQEWTTIEWVGVEAAYQRQGIGKRLLQEQMRYQARRGIKHIMVWTQSNNEAARKLNEALGFIYGPECWVLTKSL